MQPSLHKAAPQSQLTLARNSNFCLSDSDVPLGNHAEKMTLILNGVTNQIIIIILKSCGCSRSCCMAWRKQVRGKIVWCKELLILFCNKKSNKSAWGGESGVVEKVWVSSGLLPTSSGATVSTVYIWWHLSHNCSWKLSDQDSFGEASKVHCSLPHSSYFKKMFISLARERESVETLKS